MVQESLLAFDSRHYHLLAWVIMPNHVHALFEPKQSRTSAKIVGAWKKFTARKICAILRSSGDTPIIPVWQREYWDRYIRDEAHLHQTIEYIQQNPVKARLAAKPEDWPWSSSRERQSPDWPLPKSTL
jgi:REP element-mobilizing transposase RayT